MSTNDPNFPGPGEYPNQWPGQPAPVQPHSDFQAYQRRPGIITAVGVISIVVALLSGMASLMSGCEAAGLYAMSAATKMAASNPQAFAPPPATTTAAPGASTSGPGGAALTNGTALNANEIAGAVQRVQTASGNKLNPAQINGLTTALQDPNQTLVAPGTAWSPVRTANVGPDGTATIAFTGGFTTITSAGQVTPIAFPMIEANGAVCLACGIEALLSIILAIYLFVIGIVALGRSASGRRMHLIYAIAKIPLAFAGAWAMGSVYSAFYGGMGKLSGGANMAATGWTAGIALGMAGLIYPVALLFVMNSRGVRDYYNQLKAR